MHAKLLLGGTTTHFIAKNNLSYRLSKTRNLIVVQIPDLNIPMVVDIGGVDAVLNLEFDLLENDGPIVNQIAVLEAFVHGATGTGADRVEFYDGTTLVFYYEGKFVDLSIDWPAGSPTKA
ncbi:MAG: hypothetical protein QXI60_08505, partial [Thermofilaceae archaeon]